MVAINLPGLGNNGIRQSHGALRFIDSTAGFCVDVDVRIDWIWRIVFF